MALYMVQKMSSGVLPAITYYRKQSGPHPSHEESGAFTTDATNAYANTNTIAVALVEAGTYKSGQGVPTGGTTELI
ncbi:hypothetical protein [Variovorax sp. J22R115]|uniref:hypothetical protein n=1 Tax=Variovorax sp. J22R115 TaxID=3053509 RepID=UPI002577F693|nr:hypothetical protein [Variovorax sp. J22R115]MDM0053022.1 hypothetical protein [Variovorax sp. J22R115]